MKPPAIETTNTFLFPHGGILNIESFNGILSCLPADFFFIDIVLQLSVENYPIAHFVKM